MPDYYVSAVRYDDDHDRITHIKCHSNKRSNGFSHSRRTVIDNIDNNNKSYMSVKSDWSDGAEIHTVDGEYIRTDQNNTKADNLGNLPEF